VIFLVYFSLISFFFLSLGGTCRVKLSRDINETGLQLTSAGLDVLKDKSFIVTELDHTSGILLYIQATSNETNDRTISQHSEKRKGKEKKRCTQILTYRMSSPLVTVLRRRVLNPVCSMPGKPPMLAPKNVSNRSKGLVCGRKSNFVRCIELYGSVEDGCNLV
jgi:hypothetical protein